MSFYCFLIRDSHIIAKTNRVNSVSWKYRENLFLSRFSIRITKVPINFRPNLTTLKHCKRSCGSKKNTHSTADPMPNFWFGFNQTSESLDNFNVTKLPNPDQSNRSTVQWVRPVMTYLIKQTRPLKDKAPEKIILVFHWFISRFLCGFFLVFVDRFEISFSELLRKSAPTKNFVFRIALYHVTGGGSTSVTWC